MANRQWLLFHCQRHKIATSAIGMEARTTPVRSPESNGMAEAFVKTFKRDYVSINPTPEAKTVIKSLHLWFEHYNELHPHKALGYRSPREFIAEQINQ